MSKKVLWGVNKNRTKFEGVLERRQGVDSFAPLPRPS